MWRSSLHAIVFWFRLEYLSTLACIVIEIDKLTPAKICRIHNWVYLRDGRKVLVILSHTLTNPEIRHASIGSIIDIWKGHDKLCLSSCVLSVRDLMLVDVGEDGKVEHSQVFTAFSRGFITALISTFSPNEAVIFPDSLWDGSKRHWSEETHDVNIFPRLGTFADDWFDIVTKAENISLGFPRILAGRRREYVLDDDDVSE